MLMQMAFLVNVASACGRIIWHHRREKDARSSSAFLDQPFASSSMGDSMDADLLPELSRETWVATTYLDEVTADLPPAESEPDLIVASRLDETLITVLADWSDCTRLSPDLRSWQLQFGNLSIDTEARSSVGMPGSSGDNFSVSGTSQ